MKYAVKITRRTSDNTTHVSAVSAVPEHTTPYRLKYVRAGYAESLRVFASRSAAAAARDAELTAAKFSTMTPEKLTNVLTKDLNRVANFGVRLSALCRIAGINYARVCRYLRGEAPNPRCVAKFHIIADAFARVANSADDLLPLELTGNSSKSRGGRSEIWTDAPQFSTPRGKF